jgi:hypothetical protein
MASVVGAEVAAAEEVLVADWVTATMRALGLWLFGFDSLSSPLEWGVGEELVAAASALRSSLLLFGHFGAGVGEPPGVLSPHRPSNVGVVRTCGGGTGVPFVMAP